MFAENSFREITLLNVFRPLENEKLSRVFKFLQFEECFRKFRFGDRLVWKIILASDGPLTSLCGSLPLLSRWSTGVSHLKLLDTEEKELVFIGIGGFFLFFFFVVDGPQKELISRKIRT